MAGVDFSVPIIAAIESKVKIKADYPQEFGNRHLAVI
jgi:hypothetical protein